MSAEPPIPDAQQTRAERELLRAVKAGDIADVTKYAEAEKKVRPKLLRWLCLNSANRDIVDGHGIFLHGGKIPGTLDLSFLNIVVPLALIDCTLGHLGLQSANTRELVFHNSHFSDGIFAQGVKATCWLMMDAKVFGTCDINSAVLEGQFSANGASFDGKGDYAILAQGIKAKSWFMDGAEIIGTFNINSAVLEGQICANCTSFRSDGEEAIYAQGVSATDWFMDNANLSGTFDINGAVLEGQFKANGANFDGKDSKAIRAQGVKANGWLLQHSVDGKAVTVKGALDLNHAEIKFLDLDNALLSNPQGTALRLDRSRIETVVTSDCFSAIDGIYADHAEIKELYLRHARLTAKSDDCALSAEFAQIGRLDLPWGIRDDKTDGVQPGEQCIINLSRAKIGTLVDAADGWFPPQKITDKKAAANLSYIVLDGTEYDYLANPDGRDAPMAPKGGTVWQARRNWLLSQRIDKLKERFNPQPWTQLAQTLVRMGYQEDARQIAITRRNIQRKSETFWPHRGWNYLLYEFAEYSFNPWRTIFWSFNLILLFAIIYAGIGQCWGDCAMHFNPGDLQHPLLCGDFMAVDGDFLPAAGEKAKAAFDYPSFNPWLYSLDLFIPILDLGSDAYWRPISLGGYLVTVFEQVIGAIMVALAITGFSGLLTSDDKL